jgi:hypothetical protein
MYSLGRRWTAKPHQRPEVAPIVKDINARLFEVLESTGGMSMPLYPDRGGQSKTADFPRDFTSPPPKAAKPK